MNDIIPFWVVYLCFALGFGITMSLTVVPSINKLLDSKRPRMWKFWNHVVFFSFSTVFMPIVSLVVLSDTKSFIESYVGAMNED